MRRRRSQAREAWIPHDSYRKYSSAGEQQSLGSGQRFGDFVAEWKTHYADEYGLTSNSLEPMLNVLKEGLGAFTLEQLAGNPLLIERWLKAICILVGRGFSPRRFA